MHTSSRTKETAFIPGYIQFYMELSETLIITASSYAVYQQRLSESLFKTVRSKIMK